MLFMMIHIANPHRKSGIPALISQLRYTWVACGGSWGCCSPRLFFFFFFLRSCAPNSTRVAVVPRNVCGLRTCCGAYGGGCVPGAVKYCAEASVSRQWTNLSNPSDKQLRRLTSLSLAKLVLSLSQRKVGFCNDCEFVTWLWRIQ